MQVESRAICTIVTPNYLPYALALHESLCESLQFAIPIFIFVSSYKEKAIGLKSDHLINYLFIDDLCEQGQGSKLKEKYFESDVSAFRWSMKSVLLIHLLQLRYEKVLFLDGDLYFYSSPEFIFDRLTFSSVLLTPHWRATDPNVDKKNFGELLNKGLYNAGFIGVNRHAIEILEWWGRLCLYSCHFDPKKGYYADQGYLNLFPVYFEEVGILRHKGCNVANWNIVECQRTVDSDGKVKINGQFPIVFIHFTANTMRAILAGKDPYLRPHLEKYAESLKKFDATIDIIKSHTLAKGKKKVLPQIS